MAVWGQKWYIVGGLVAISLGHWSLLLHGILLTAEWVPGEGCVITSTDSKLLSATFIYSMSFDFIVLLLTASRLVRPTGGKSQLVNRRDRFEEDFGSVALEACRIKTVTRGAAKRCNALRQWPNRDKGKGMLALRPQNKMICGGTRC